MYPLAKLSQMDITYKFHSTASSSPNLQSHMQPRAPQGIQNVNSRALTVAARCHAALGDAACARLLKEIVQLGTRYAEETGNEPLASPDCWAKLAILKGELKTAEAIYLEQNELTKALDMYQRYWHWEDALNLAQNRRWSGLAQLR